MPWCRSGLYSLFVTTALFTVACAPGSDRRATPVAGAVPPPRKAFNAVGPWLSFYGTAREMGDLGRVARTFRIINIDADPGVGNFTPAQIARLKAGGTNRVIGYLDIGSIERFRTYWSRTPAGFVAGRDNHAAQRGPYEGYPDEVWMDPSNADYQRLIVDYVAPRLAAQGVDGFFLDNLEIVEHGTHTENGPCDAACAQGGLDLVRRLRARFPNMLIVMQNATGDFTRLGRTGGTPFPALLDGISHEEVYAPAPDPEVARQLAAWKTVSQPGGRRLWIGTEDYVGSCANVAGARSVYRASRAAGYSPYATDASGGQRDVCYWPF